MIINHNLQALNTFNRMQANNLGMSKALERLSSGLRINRAADDAAGLSISEKMRSQIRGLHQATRNVQDGVSLIQTAEGALGEVHEILQRTRELCIQASNDTYTSNDRQEIQSEIDQLRDELDRIASTTQFNAKNLLDGSTSALVSTDKIGTRVFMRGGLISTDAFNEKISGSGNYRLEISALTGSAQVQKTDIFKIKHPIQKVADFTPGDTSIEYISTTGGPDGYYTVDTVADLACVIDCLDTPVHSSATVSAAYFQNPLAVATVCVSPENGVNASALFEVTSASATSVTLRATVHQQGDNGSYTLVSQCITLNAITGACAFSLGCIDGLRLELDPVLSHYTAGDKFVVDINATSNATRNYSAGTTGIPYFSSICAIPGSYILCSDAQLAACSDASILMSSCYYQCNIQPAAPALAIGLANAVNASVLFEVCSVNVPGDSIVCRVTSKQMDRAGALSCTTANITFVGGFAIPVALGGLTGMTMNLAAGSAVRYTAGDRFVADVVSDATGPQRAFWAGTTGFNSLISINTVPPGTYFLNSSVRPAAATTASATFTNSQRHFLNAAVTPPTITLSHANQTNSSVLFEVCSVNTGANNIVCRVTSYEMAENGTISTNIIPAATLNAGTANAIALANLCGFTVNPGIIANIANYTAGDEFMMDIKAANDASTNFLRGTTNLCYISTMNAPTGNYQLVSDVAVAAGAVSTINLLTATNPVPVPIFTVNNNNTNNASIIIEVCNIDLLCVPPQMCCRICTIAIDNNGNQLAIPAATVTISEGCANTAAMAAFGIAGLGFDPGLINTYAMGDRFLTEVTAETLAGDTSIDLNGPAGGSSVTKSFGFNNAVFDNANRSIRSFYLCAATGTVLIGCFGLYLTNNALSDGTATFTANTFSDTLMTLTGPVNGDPGYVSIAKQISLSDGAINASDPTFHTFYVNCMNGCISAATFQLDLNPGVLTNGTATICVGLSDSSLTLYGPSGASSGSPCIQRTLIFNAGILDDCISAFRSFYVNACTGATADTAYQIDMAGCFLCDGQASFCVTDCIYARTQISFCGPVSCSPGFSAPTKVFAYTCGTLNNTETDLHTFYLDTCTGWATDSAFRITLRDSCITTSLENDASFCINNNSIGTLADPSTQLYDMEKFWDQSGNFVLEPPKTITLVQGNGASAQISFNKADTVSSVIDKLNTAIAVQLGQCALTGGDNRHFASYVNLPGRGSGQEAVAGTFVIRSAIPGQDGAISFFGDDNVVQALSLMTIQDARDNIFTVNVTDAHSGSLIACNVVISGNNLVGVIHPNVDVQFAENTGINVSWNTASRRFDAISSGICVTYIHLADSSMVFQVGANQHQDVMAAIGNMSVRALGMDNIQVFTNQLANEALSRIDAAIARVSHTRSALGAVQNRLEHTFNNLSATAENLTAAESRIRDADMAQEMMNFTRFNVLTQASTAMLAQANQSPQTVLQLLK